MYSTNDAKLLKSTHVVNFFEIQTKWTEFRPNSDHYWTNGLNSDWLRKIRPEWQQWIWIQISDLALLDPIPLFNMFF